MRNSDHRRVITLCNQSLPDRHIVNMPTEGDLCCVIFAVAASQKKKGQKKCSKKGRKWIKQWLIDRKKCTHKRLLNELRIIEPNDFRNFVRMNTDVFDELLALVAPAIEKNKYYHARSNSCNLTLVHYSTLPRNRGYI